MIDHCISLFSKRQRENVYKMYVTDALKVIARNTSRLGGASITRRFADIIEGMYAKPEEEANADDVIENIRNKLKGG